MSVWLSAHGKKEKSKVRPMLSLAGLATNVVGNAMDANHPTYMRTSRGSVNLVSPGLLEALSKKRKVKAKTNKKKKKKRRHSSWDVQYT